jgi:hypothetical protein
MRGLFLACIVACSLLGDWTPASAQQQPTAPEKVDQAKPTEPKKAEREGTAVVVSYMLAIIGTIIVMVLVCMPARRE